MDPRQVIRRFAQDRLEYHCKLDSRETFGQGWTNHTNRIEQAVLEMVQQTCPIA